MRVRARSVAYVCVLWATPCLPPLPLPCPFASTPWPPSSTSCLHPSQPPPPPPAAGDGQVHKCLRSNREKLTDQCRKEELLLEAQESSNIELNVGLLKACKVGFWGGGRAAQQVADAWCRQV